MIGTGAGTRSGSEYCFLCGLPFTDAGLSLPDDDTFDLEWLEYGIGFDPRRRTISMVHSDDGYGRFQIEGTRKWFCNEDRPSPQCEFSGRVCHMDCSEFVETTIGRRLDVETMMRLYHQSVDVQSRDYQGQFYHWDDALAAEGAELFQTPKSDYGYDGSSLQRRIRKCLVASGLLATATATYDELLVACLSASQRLSDVVLRHRHAKEMGKLPGVAEVVSLALAVSNDLDYLAGKCADANRAPTTIDVGAERASPTTVGKCSRLKKGECAKQPGCKWKKSQGCVSLHGSR